MKGQTNKTQKRKISGKGPGRPEVARRGESSMGESHFMLQSSRLSRFSLQSEKMLRSAFSQIFLRSVLSTRPDLFLFLSLQWEEKKAQLATVGLSKIS